MVVPRSPFGSCPPRKIAGGEHIFPPSQGGPWACLSPKLRGPDRLIYVPRGWFRGHAGGTDRGPAAANQGIAERIRARGTDQARETEQDPAGRIRDPQDETGPRETVQGPIGLIRAPRDGSGPRKMNQGPIDRAELRGTSRSPQDGSGTRRTNQRPWDRSGSRGD